MTFSQRNYRHYKKTRRRITDDPPIVSFANLPVIVRIQSAFINVTNSACEIWARARYGVVHELHAGSFLQYRGLFLPGLARLPDRSCSADDIHRMVTATSAYSSGCAGVDLSQLDCTAYIRAMARIF